MKTINFSLPENMEEAVSLVLEQKVDFLVWNLDYSTKDLCTLLVASPVFSYAQGAIERLIYSRCRCIGHVRHQATIKKTLHPYDCIPLDVARFVRTLHKATELMKSSGINTGISFVDAGSGVGDKVRVAYDSMMVSRACGVELSKEFCAIADSLCHLGIKNIRADITTFDFSSFNLIYAYNPMDSVKGMTLFFENVIKTAKPGTYCMFFNVHTGGRALEKLKEHFTQVDKYIYILKGV